MKWYRKAADAGDADAMILIAVRYKFGHDIKKDEAEAVKWFRNASDTGHRYAPFSPCQRY